MTHSLTARKPPTEKNLDELRCLTLKQTAELLRVSVRILESMIQRKELPAIRSVTNGVFTKVNS